MRTFSVEDVARAEFDDAAAWYESERTGLGVEFIAEVDRVLERIEHRDEVVTAPIARYPGAVLRREFVRRFPYVVVFLETDALRRVILIHRSNSDPALRRSRL